MLTGSTGLVSLRLFLTRLPSWLVWLVKLQNVTDVYKRQLVFLTPEGEEFKDQIRPILDQVYVYAEKIIGIESIETMSVSYTHLDVYKRQVSTL